MQYKHIPEVLLKLESCGYSKQFCRGMIVKNFQEVNLKVLLGALRRWPLYAIQTVIPFLVLVGRSAINVLTAKELKMVKVSNESLIEKTSN